MRFVDNAGDETGEEAKDELEQEVSADDEDGDAQNVEGVVATAAAVGVDVQVNHVEGVIAVVVFVAAVLDVAEEDAFGYVHEVLQEDAIPLAEVRG